MALSVRRLGPGDATILTRLATDDADFDLAGRGGPLRPLDPGAAERYLADPAVLHWVALEADAPVGHLFCVRLSLRAGSGSELLLYEIGVRRTWRRRGVGRALLEAMEGWMRENGVSDVWVLADNPAAVDFYGACGFVTSDDPFTPVYMVRQLATPEA